MDRGCSLVRRHGQEIIGTRQQSILPASPQLRSASRGWVAAVDVNKAVLVGRRKTSVLRGSSPKRHENHKNNRLKKFRLEVVQPVDSRLSRVPPSAFRGCRCSCIGVSAKTSVLGSAPEPQENSEKIRSEIFANGHMLYRFSSNRNYDVDRRKYSLTDPKLNLTLPS